MIKIQSKNSKLRLVEVADAAFILSLRLDLDRSQYLSKTKEDLKSQEQWIEEYKIREYAQKEYYFIITDITDQKVGTLRLYDFQNNSFCWGSWILKKDINPFISLESALLVYELAFYRLGFTRTHFDVRKENQKVIAFHQRMGAKIISEDENNYYFNYSKSDYEYIKPKYQSKLC